LSETPPSPSATHVGSLGSLDHAVATDENRSASKVGYPEILRMTAGIDGLQSERGSLCMSRLNMRPFVIYKCEHRVGKTSTGVGAGKYHRRVAVHLVLCMTQYNFVAGIEQI